ncbi:dimethylaniline monooxygenase [Mycobacterium sp. MS1601]|nr:dimethylaniline monooxygenase [Mycobacterium sp. MS1601]
MKVCVVGAGPCGLTTIKQLLDEGHDVVCFDKNPDLGGIWLRHEGDEDTTKAFDNLMLTISMKLMAYSDHPFQGERRFYSREQYLNYLKGYSDRYRLAEHIRPGHTVTGLKRNADSWTVTVEHDGIETTQEFGAVAICSGPFKTPHKTIPGLEDFTGEIVHSAEYRNNKRFAGKRVLVVGLAESGADIVREIGDVAEACTLAIRSYTFLLPRIYNGTRSTDHGTVRAHLHEMYDRSSDYPQPLQTFWGTSKLAKALFVTLSVVYGFATAAVGVVNKLRGHRTAPPLVNPMGEPVLPAKLDIGTVDTPENMELIKDWNRRSHRDGSWSQRGIFCKNVSFVPSIVSGRVTVNDSGIERSDGKKVFFCDAKAAEFDTVVLCTGYEKDLRLGDLEVKDNNVRNLYKHFLHPDHNGTAAFIGFVRPFSGGIPICAEMQARYFALVCSGKLALPADLEQVISREKDWEEHWTSLSPRHTESIPSQILYLDSLAREVGCLIPMRKLVLNPKLFVQLWFGSFNPSCYRVVGPHNRGPLALADLYSEPVEDRFRVAFRFSLLRLMPSKVHPKHLFG